MNFIFFKKVYKKFNKIIHGKYSVPIGDDYLGMKAEVYEKTRKCDNFWQKEHDLVLRVISSLVKKKKISNVLDLPAGTGRFYKIYELNNINYIGGDSSIDMLNIANKEIRNQTLGRNQIMISTKIPLQRNSVDIVVSFRFLQWIVSLKDMKKTLLEFHRVTKKYCFIELCVGKHTIRKKPINENLTMWNNFNLEEIKDILYAHGFKIIEIEFISDDKENPNMHSFLCSKI
jgi:ubiquinone/menaquinone biosynthesis C-methylase UbiE